MLNSECPYPRGDYDNWEALVNAGWSYRDALPFFVKSENSHIDREAGYHGKKENLNVEYHKPSSPQFYAFIDANVELGRKVADYNERQQLGVSPVQSNTISCRRQSVSSAFLEPILHRSNLTVLTHSFAIKILINKSTKKAYGILFSHKNQIYKAKERKEIIISAGTINFSQLLMLSGIGPEHHLKHHDIPVLESLA
ncbi:hypothetical protein ILUMI_18067, partial [Ignelater luminosus]